MTTTKHYRLDRYRIAKALIAKVRRTVVVLRLSRRQPPKLRDMVLVPSVEAAQ